jgi:hypothetical protein
VNDVFCFVSKSSCAVFLSALSVFFDGVAVDYAVDLSCQKVRACVVSLLVLYVLLLQIEGYFRDTERVHFTVHLYDHASGEICVEFRLLSGCRVVFCSLFRHAVTALFGLVEHSIQDRRQYMLLPDFSALPQTSPCVEGCRRDLVDGLCKQTLSPYIDTHRRSLHVLSTLSERGTYEEWYRQPALVQALRSGLVFPDGLSQEYTSKILAHLCSNEVFRTVVRTHLLDEIAAILHTTESLESRERKRRLVEVSGLLEPTVPEETE